MEKDTEAPNHHESPALETGSSMATVNSEAIETKAQPTAGPWRVGELVRSHLGYRCLPVVAIDYEVVADCEYQSDHEGSRVRAEANASLIAAAPDLLAALKATIPVLGAWNGMGLTSDDQATAWRCYQQSPEMRRINAAIAKAEGRA